MTAVGEKLRKERIRQGVEIAKLATDTRINARYLEAIEAGDLSSIPGGFFYRSFVRQYALALGMNAAELEADLERAREAEAPVLNAALEKAQFPLKAPDPIVVATNRRLAPGRIGAYVCLLVGVVAGCSAFYGWWNRAQTPQAAAEQQVSVDPSSAEKTAPPIATPVMATADSGQVSAGPNTPDARVMLAVSAREKTWLSVSSDGKLLFSGVLQPSEIKIVGSKTRASVKVGNAAGLEITWNGKSLGQIGQHGEVLTLVFTPENYQILPRAGSL